MEIVQITGAIFVVIWLLMYRLVARQMVSYNFANQICIGFGLALGISAVLGFAVFSLLAAMGMET